jgi:hypothetical protein
LDLPVFVLKALSLKNKNLSHLDTSNFLPLFIKFSGPLELRLDSIRQKNFAHNEMFFFNLNIFYKKSF